MARYYDVIIIGAGPAGVFCAISLKEKNQNTSIAIIEKDRPLKKLLLSGGGRCNLSNIKANSKDCLKFYPRGSRFISHLFYQYDFKSFCNWLKINKIETKIEEEGKIFLKSNNSNELESAFLKKLSNYKIDIINEVFTDFVLTKNDKKNFKIITRKEDENKIYYSNYLVIAPGSNREILRLIKSKGIDVLNFIPSLYGFRIKELENSNLAGVSLKNIQGFIEYSSNFENKFSQSEDLKNGNLNENDIENFYNKIDKNECNKIKLNQKKMKLLYGDLLFTHEGLSGPLILKLSSYNAIELFQNNYKAFLHLDLFPDKNMEILEKELSIIFHKGAKLIKNICYEINIPSSFWRFIINRLNISSNKISNQITGSQIKKITKELKDLIFRIDGKSISKEEFVSAQGIDLKDIDKECKSKKITNLYFIGEILNIDGITGGYNLQSCWTTAYVCANSIAKSFFQNQV
ncbi:MAG: NAD(P)/FAD-dependent oxidoreductase [Exilispira sp.]